MDINFIIKLCPVYHPAEIGMYVVVTQKQRFKLGKQSNLLEFKYQA